MPSVKAEIKLILTMSTGSNWGKNHTVEQIKKQGLESILFKLSKALDKDKFSIDRISRPECLKLTIEITKFKTNKTYSTGSDHVFKINIISRTPKTIKVKIYGEIVSRRIYILDDEECFKPFESYSMAPVFRAA